MRDVDFAPWRRRANRDSAEVKAVKAAAARFGKDYKPRITFIILAKRHHMRFFAMNEQDGDKTGNLPAGTFDASYDDLAYIRRYRRGHKGLSTARSPTTLLIPKLRSVTLLRTTSTSSPKLAYKARLSRLTGMSRDFYGTCRLTSLTALFSWMRLE